MSWIATSALYRAAAFPGGLMPVVQSLYNTIGTLITNGLNGDNFAFNAGIPEQAIRWTTHSHADGSLGDAVINNSNLETYGENQSVQFALTLSPGIMAIVGVTKRLEAPSFIPLASYKLRIYFAEASRFRTGFLPGTRPVVVLSLMDHDNQLYGGFTRKVYYYVTDVTSEYFDLQVMMTGSFTSGSSFSIYFLAFGQAPGAVRAF